MNYLEEIKDDRKMDFQTKVLIVVLILIVLIYVAVGGYYINENNKSQKEVEYLSGIEKTAHKLPDPEYVQDQKKAEKIVEAIDGIYKSNYKRVYLTFDDGPSPITPKILDILNQNGIKATFFMLGSQVVKYPKLVKRAYDEGNYIANHSYTHEYSSLYASPENVLNEYNETEKAIQKAIENPNYNSRLFRFPGGTPGGKHAELKKQAAELLTQNQIAHLDWNALTADSAGLKDPAEMLAYVEKLIGNKESVVILMHDAGGKVGTQEMLPSLIQYLKNNGYKFETIYDLLANVE